MPGCILVLCGLPGSGKTTLVSHLVPCAVREKISCVVVDYDRLMPPDVERSLIDQASQDEAKLWKHYREAIVACTDKLLNSVNPSNLRESDIPPLHKEKNLLTEREAESQREAPSQNEALTQMKATCQSEVVDQRGPRCQRKTEEEVWQNFSKIVDVSSVSSKDKDVLVIVDDNMYYRSMRYHYYQLARKYTYGFCEAYMKCSSSEALVRNRKRSTGRVNDAVIVAMETKLEAPDSAVNNWEKHSIEVTFSTESCCSEILRLVRAAMLDPVIAPEENTEERQESRRVCSSNTVHQADQIIRKLLAQQLKAAKEEGKTKEEMKMLSTRFSDVKAAILKDMRSGVISSETDVNNASKDESSELFRFLQNIFDNRTAKMS